MENYKYCERCKKKYYKTPNRRGKRWTESKYCGLACQRKGFIGWNKGKKLVLSDDARQRMADNARRNLLKETPDQKASRYKKIIESRKRNGIWTPPALGKRGAERINVWKGEEATYNGKHRWIQNNWEKTGECQNCHVKPRPFGNRKYGTEWANLDSKYNRDDKNTWMELCVKCHRRYDKNLTI